MKNGSLRDHLYGCNYDPLPWKQRLEICIGAARGLHYLHTGAKHAVIHRDIKSRNILLDDKWVSKLSSFFFSKMRPQPSYSSTSKVLKKINSRLVGTVGYVDPEYLRGCELSEKCDVYSFGVVLFEVLCARRSYDSTLDENEQFLVYWVRWCIGEGIIYNIIDSYLKGKIALECLKIFLRHQHLVSLIGFCNDKDELILVYPLMKNGTLCDHLYGSGCDPLPWKQRLEICIGAARGLHYLHTGIKYAIIHSNVDSNNILLDDKWVSKLSSFGFSKMRPQPSYINTSKALKNIDAPMAGYWDPEYQRDGGLSEKCDVYSFGVVLFEVLCARPVIDRRLDEHKQHLVYWVCRCIGDGTIYNIIDSYLKGKIAPEWFKIFVDIAYCCIRYGLKEFQTEVQFLCQLRHQHLVSLMGYCNDKDEKIAVYELMKNGSLGHHLYGCGYDPLPWKQRLEICIGAARGLHYLHTGAKHAVIHRNVKSNNILLDDKWVGKVSDFGLAKMRPQPSYNNSKALKKMVSGVEGSFGYLDPEYIRDSEISEKCDVYSFGVVLFEVLCARPALLNPIHNSCKVYLSDWVRLCIGEGTIYNIIDPYLKGNIAPECFKIFLRHQHLVSLFGICSDKDEMILVSEVVKNGTLSDHLYGSEYDPLPWKQRLKICIDAARGLHYLHTRVKPAIIHSDVKSSNILLDYNLVGKLSDFGLSKMCLQLSYFSTSKALEKADSVVKGSNGCLDPEHLKDGGLSKESDVYSFGVVLFEVLCARKVFDPTLDEDERHLVDWVRRCIGRGTIYNIIDPYLKGKIAPGCFRRFMDLAYY
ncbi:Serine-threonine/tyrosine-protein kinase, partial [Theobroma cacao]